MSSFYIVPADVLAASPPQIAEWHATSIPADPSQLLVAVLWDNSTLSAEIAFEAQAGVLPLGERWEPLPDVAVPLLASLQSIDLLSSADGTVPSLPATDTPPPETVAAALRKITWPGARLK